jgi:chemotaxis response regulator CheB
MCSAAESFRSAELSVTLTGTGCAGLEGMRTIARGMRKAFAFITNL